MQKLRIALFRALLEKYIFPTGKNYFPNRGVKFSQ